MGFRQIFVNQMSPGFKGTIRGFHLQKGTVCAGSKLVRVVSGEVLDVVLLIAEKDQKPLVSISRFI